MKKYIIALILAMVSSISYGDTITFDTATTNNDITRTWLNNTFYTVYNTVNGGLDSNNIASGGVASDDIATSANPLVRDNELIGELVYTGLTIAVPAPASLTGTIAAGTAYIENDGDSTLHRVVMAATSKTFTASKDTWVYLDYTGAFTYNEQALGAAQPTTPDNNMIIAKVVTDGTGITSVADYRQTTPTNLRIYSYYKNGLVISRDVTTTTKVTIGPGEIELGADSGGRRVNASSINVDFTVSGRGGLDTGAIAANTYYYIHVIADEATSTGIDGIASLSSSDVTGFTGERLVGWCWSNSASAISPDSVGAYRGKGGDAPNICATIISDDVTATTATYVAIPEMYTKFFTSGRPMRFTFSAPMHSAAGSVNIFYQLRIDGLPVCAGANITDQVNEASMARLEWSETLSAGEHYADVYWKSDGANASYIYGSQFGKRALIIEEL